MKAAHSHQWVSISTGRGCEQIEVQPGQFVYGRSSGAVALKMNPSTLRNRMAKLERIGNITMDPDSHYTLVSICNWAAFQDESSQGGQPKDRQRTTKGQAKDRQRTTKRHIQECIRRHKNVENGKNGEKLDETRRDDDFSLSWEDYAEPSLALAKRISEIAPTKGRTAKDRTKDRSLLAKVAFLIETKRAPRAWLDEALATLKLVEEPRKPLGLLTQFLRDGCKRHGLAPLNKLLAPIKIPEDVLEGKG
jgi:hypothetical protein